MHAKQIVGIVVAVICVLSGVYLLVNAGRSMDKTGQKIKHKITGNYSHEVRNHMIGGIVLIIIGGAVYYFTRSSGRKHS